MDIEFRNENPLRKATFFNKCFFWWVKDIIKRGRKVDLDPSDVYEVMPEDSSELLKYPLAIAWEKEMNSANLKLVKPSLTKVIIKTYYKTFLKLISFMSLYMIGLLIQPQLLKRVILYFDPKSNVSSSEVGAYATMSIIVLAFLPTMSSNCSFRLNRLGMQIKVALSVLIFKKITKLPSSSTSRNKSSSAISLLSVDVSRFDTLLFFLACIALLPLQLVGVIYFVYTNVGLIASLTGVAVMILQTVPLQMLFYKVVSKWRAKQAANTDKRISLIDEVVAGVRLIKMYAWETYFEKLVCQSRSLENRGFLKISYLTSAVDSLVMISHRICLLIVTLVNLLLHEIIKIENVLTARQHFYILRTNLSAWVFMGVQGVTNAHVSINRIQEFLTLPDVKSSVARNEDVTSFGTIIIDDVTAFWDETTEMTTLRNINIEFEPKKFYAILGETGSGKSSLLKLILGELSATSGRVSVAGEISYASQEPWLFNASIRENILFGETYDMERYDEVVSACALVEDFNNLPHSDQTLVGDRGMSLSGGQCARINMARAVYRQADIYLLDDPFSAVDTRVAKKLRSQCIDELLKDKTVILVTHNVYHLRKTDHIIFLDSGNFLLHKSYVEFKKSDKYSNLLRTNEADVFESSGKLEEYTKTEKHSEENFIRRNENVPLNQNQEAIGKGITSKSVFVKYIKAGGYTDFSIIITSYILLTYLMLKFDFGTKAWAGVESKNVKNQTQDHKDIFQEESFNSSSNEIKSPIIVNSIYILTLLVATTIVKNVLMYRFIYKANKNLHNSMFAHLIRTPLRFFEQNPAGRILNRFAEDVGSLDDAMSRTFIKTIDTIFYVVGSLILILIVRWWNIVTITFTALIFVRIGHIYLVAVPKFKRLIGIAKSPVLNSVTSTLNGLTTIRSCKAENFIMKEFSRHLDKHTAAYFLDMAASSAFTLWIETLVAGLFACTTCTFIATKNFGILGGDTGLTLTAICEIFVISAFSVKQFITTCSHMVSVERILQYTELEPEQVVKKDAIHDELGSWPSKGEISFERVYLKYSDEGKPVFTDLSFTIEAGTKIGIVGRTGAGKSSLISALFRLAKVDGQLFIDDVDTKDTDLAELRSRISIIPQEPILFSATLRSNLDPLNEFNDAALWSALDSVGLKKTFSSLDQMIEKAGKNLSLGQRQLLCLARVILKDNRILVLDEATASVDSATDEQVQKVIREKFESCTVLVIAHRLNTIMDSDKVLVMDHGRIVEYDHPHVLLQNSEGHFSKMVEQTGEQMSQHLRAIAENAYNGITIKST